MNLPKEVVIPRDKWTTGYMRRPDDTRCAIGWMVYACGGEARSLRLNFHEMPVEDVIREAAVIPWLDTIGEFGAWIQRVIVANDGSHFLRERRLTKLFAAQGITLRFVDTLDRDEISDEFNRVATESATEPVTVTA